MADRDLLELAAKAAGHRTISDIDGNLYLRMQDMPQHPWNPLDDDGDALRLAATLRLWVHIDEYGGSARRPGDAWLGCEAHKYGGIEAATRRAIVRVAAAIGKEQ